MSLGLASLGLLLQLGFGSLLTLLLVDRRALGPKYDKFAGWVLLGLFGLAGSLVWGAVLRGGTTHERALGAAVAAAAVLCLLFASVSGWDRPRLESALLGAAAIAAAGAVGLACWQPALVAGLSGTERALVLAGALGSSLVLGFTTWGMILGHWYLVAHQLDIAHLARLVRPLPWILAGKLAVSALALWLMWDHVLGPADRSLSDLMARSPGRVLDVASLWARIPVGLVVPGVMALMTRVTVRMEKTQPATGILYAMCGTVYLGEGFGAIVQASFGVPL